MIRPMALHDGAVWLRHDRELVNGVEVGGHDGVAEIDRLRYARDQKGTRFDRLELVCPDADCAWMSIQPLGGGGLSREGTRLLQSLFVEKRAMNGYPLDEAFDDVCDRIDQQYGPERNELRPLRPVPGDAEPVAVESVTEDPEVRVPDLSDAIVEEIDRTLAVPFQSTISPTLVEILDYLQTTRSALGHRTAALQRIKATLQAAAELRDADVTAV